MKKMNYFFCALLAMLAVACTTESDPATISESEEPEVEVVNERDYLPNSLLRSASSASDTTKVLKFKDVGAFFSMYDRLSEQSRDEKIKTFAQLQFEGVYTQYAEADKELDSIFDIEIHHQFLTAYKVFKEKYQNTVLFNDSDAYDLTVLPRITNEYLALLGNKNGAVVIGGLYVTPDNSTSIISRNGNTDSSVHDLSSSTSMNNTTTSKYTTPANPYFYGLPEATAAVVTKGKFRSDVSFGYDANSYLMMIRCASQKKKWFYKKRYNTDYTMDIVVNGQKFHWYVENKGIGEIKQIFAPLVDLRYYYNRGKNRYINLAFQNFTSGCCSGKYDNKTYKVDLSKVPFRY